METPGQEAEEMNHTNLAKLLLYQDQNPSDLTDYELDDYIWLVEQQLQELRQRQVQRRQPE